MSKLSNMLNMLLILETGKKYSTRELAQLLEVSERMIRTYRDDLEMAGIYIDTIKGKYGGYVINDDLNEINIGLNKGEIGILENINDILQDSDQFVFKKDYDIILKKIKKAYENSIENIDINYYGSLNLIENCELNSVFEKAIANRNKVIIWYVSFTTKIRKRIIHPIYLIRYKNSRFVLAYCETKGELRQFKFDRITKYQLLEEKFENIDIDCI